MVSKNSLLKAHARQARAQLQKGSIQAGSILWLIKVEHGDKDGLMLLETAGLALGASNHPVVIIDMLEGDPSHVQICTITSFNNTNITASKTNRQHWSFYLPIGPDPSRPPCPEPLFLKNNATMRKPSYINTRHNHKASLTLLEYYDRDEVIPSRQLTPESLGKVRSKCGLLPLRARRLDDVSAATSTVLRNTIRASPSRSICHGSPSTPDQTVPATERQPLLRPPLPATSRPKSSPIQLPPVQIPPVWLPLPHSYFLGERCSYDSHQTPNRSLLRTLLRTLFACILLCLCAALLGLLGYSLFFGLAWLVRGVISFLVVIKDDFIALGHWIAGIGRAIASPFMAVGQSITAVVREVVKVVREIVRWVRHIS